MKMRAVAGLLSALLLAGPAAATAGPGTTHVAAGAGVSYFLPVALQASTRPAAGVLYFSVLTVVLDCVQIAPTETGHVMHASGFHASGRSYVTLVDGGPANDLLGISPEPTADVPCNAPTAPGPVIGEFVIVP